MGDKKQCSAFALLQIEEQFDDGVSGVLIEVACWLIGEKNLGACRKGAGDGNALLLAARKLSRIMIKTVAKADPFQGFGGAGRCIGQAPELHGDRHVLDCRESGDEMEGLENDADVFTADAGQCFLGFSGKIFPGQNDIAAGGGLKPRHHHQERGLARPRGPDDPHRFALPHRKVHPLQDVDLARPGRECEVNVAQGENGRNRRGHAGIRSEEKAEIGCGKRNFEQTLQLTAIRPTWTVMSAMLLRRTVLSLLALAPFAPAAVAAQIQPLTILALGDSLTAGLGLEQNQAFPAKLEEALKAKGHDVKVLNAGVSGDTAVQGAARLDWSLTEDVAAVIVELGANDALRGLDPVQAGAALTEIVSKLQTKKLPVLIAGMRSPPNLGPEYAASFEAIYAQFAGQEGVLLYPFFLDGVAADATLNQPDGLHPTAAGVDVIVARILPQVEALIAMAKK